MNYFSRVHKLFARVQQQVLAPIFYAPLIGKFTRIERQTGFILCVGRQKAEVVYAVTVDLQATCLYHTAFVMQAVCLNRKILGRIDQCALVSELLRINLRNITQGNNFTTSAII